jgi:hypothetical protein
MIFHVVVPSEESTSDHLVSVVNSIAAKRVLPFHTYFAALSVFGDDDAKVEVLMTTEGIMNA